LHDSLGDHLIDGSRSFRSSNNAKGLQRRDLLGNAAIEAKANEPIAEGDKRSDRIAKSPPSRLGGERACVGKRRVGECGDQRRVRQTFWASRRAAPEFVADGVGGRSANNSS
jgi:hypothetical protein